MLIHFKDPSFLEKKDFYIKIVDNLNNKSNIFLSDIYNKNNSTIFSTKDESQNNSPYIPILQSDENNIKEFNLNSNSDINSHSLCVEKTIQSNEYNEKENDPKNINNEELLNDIFSNKKENNINKISKIFPLDNNNYENDKNIDNISIFLKSENDYNIISLEDFL
jgi:hypothetical protein